MTITAQDLFRQPVLRWTQAVELRWDRPIEETAQVAIDWCAARGAILSRTQAIAAVLMAVKEIRAARRASR